MNCVSGGMQFGWTAPSIPKLKSANTPIKINHTDEVWLELLFTTGGFIGLPFSIYFLDRIGRKKTIWFSSIIAVCGWLCIGAGNHMYYFYAGRLLLGITDDMGFTASPAYVSEIAHPSKRGFLTGLILPMMFLGIIIIYSISTWIPIYASAAVALCLLLIQLVIFPFMPESPYYLVRVNKYDEAEKALKRLRTDQYVTEEFGKIKEAVERQQSDVGRPQDLFLMNTNRKIVLIILLMTSAQQLAGSTVVIMNFHTILSEAGLDINSLDLYAELFPIMMFISALIATLLIDNIGRILLFTYSGIVTAITLFITALYFHLKILGYPTDLYQWIPLMALLSYAFAIRFGVGVVPIVITAEIIPGKIKGIGLAFGDFVFLVSSSLSIYTYQWMNQVIGIHISFYVFGILCVLSTIATYFYVPETKGKTLEEIQMILKNGKNTQGNETTGINDK